jgi:hypothetical protein
MSGIKVESEASGIRLNVVHFGVRQSEPGISGSQIEKKILADPHHCTAFEVRVV